MLMPRPLATACNSASKVVASPTTGVRSDGDAARRHHP